MRLIVLLLVQLLAAAGRTSAQRGVVVGSLGPDEVDRILAAAEQFEHAPDAEGPTDINERTSESGGGTRYVTAATWWVISAGSAH